MMKKALSLCFALLSATLLLAKPYTQQGIAYLYDYKTKTKKPVANVSLTVAYAKGPAVSRTDGTFTIEFQDFGAGKKLAFEKLPFCQGLIVLNNKEVDGWSTFEGRLTLIMCNKKDFDVCKQNYYNVGFQSVTQRHEREIAALRRESADYQEQLQELEEKYERIMDNLRNSADAMARIDQSELDAAMQEVLDLYEQGNVDEAMQKLEDMKLEEKFIQTLDKKHEGERIVAEAAEDSVLMLNKLRTSVDMYKNSGNWDKATETLKLLADKLNSHDDIFAYAYFCQEQNDFLNAEIYYGKVLEIYQHLANNNPKAYELDVAATLHNLALLYFDTQRISEAEKMYKRVLKMYQLLAYDNSKAYEPYVATALNSLATLYSRTQKFKEAEEFFKHVLDIRQQLAQTNPLANELDVAQALVNLANLFLLTQSFTEAEERYKQALEIQLRLLKDSSSISEFDVAHTLHNLALLYSNTQRFTESEDMYKQSLEIRQRLANVNPKAYEPDLAQTMNNLAGLYSKTQRFTESENMYKQSLEIRQRLANVNPKAYEPYVAHTLNNLANLYSDTQRFTEAEEMYKQALEIRQRLAQDNPQTYEPDVAKTHFNFGLLFIKKEQYADAIPSFEEALRIYRKFAKDNYSLLDGVFGSLYYLSQLYAQTNNHIRNYEIRQELLPILKEMYETGAGNVRDAYATTVGGQSFNAIFMKRFSEAEQLARKGLDVDSTQHWIASNLAAAILLQGRYAEAEAIYRQYKDELKDSFLDDFEQFKAAGVIPKEREEDVKKIKKMLEE